MLSIGTSIIFYHKLSKRRMLNFQIRLTFSKFHVSSLITNDNNKNIPRFEQMLFEFYPISTFIAFQFEQRKSLSGKEKREREREREIEY